MFVAYAGGLVLASLVLLIALVIVALQVGVLVLAIPLARHGRETTGHVVKIEPARSPARVSRLMRVRVAYDTPAGTLETGGTTRRPLIGAPMAVRYDPARPARATTAVRPVRRVLVGLPMALATGALAAGVITGSVWYFAGVHGNAQASLAGGCTALAIALWSGYYACGLYVTLARRGRRKARPDESATVMTTSDVRARAIAATVAALVFLVLAILVLASAGP